MTLAELLATPDAEDQPHLDDAVGALCAALLPLQFGRFAIVDERDEAGLHRYNWHLGGNGYVVRNLHWKLQKSLSIHRHLLRPPANREVDHRNLNTLDNRRCNLRLCTRAQNNANHTRVRRSTSGFKGVCWDKFTKNWKASIGVNGRCIHLGRYPTAEAAARAYDAAARKHFGEFARPNFPKE